MVLKHNFTLDIATAPSRLSKKWRNRQWQWSELLERCKNTRRTDEGVAEYMRMSRDEQSSVKDVGGFVGGYLTNGVRKTANVKYRTLITLDIDYGTPDVWTDFILNFDCAAMIYSTHKHTPEKPRLRLVLPSDRPMSPAEYEPVCRRWAQRIGIELFDHTTYQLPRLFYWPSTSRDGDYFFNYQDGPAFDVDEILATYRNYLDASEWPLSSREGDAVAHELRKAGDPTEKPGLIGAFCRVYDIETAIATFLTDVYEPTATEGRYTYRAGSVAGGLVCYDGKYAYSHHETDPAGGQLCNAFDLVRIHKFGDLDEGCRAQETSAKPSYAAMLDFAGADKTVRTLLTKERLNNASADFDGVDVDGADWMGDLDCDKRGNVKSTIANTAAIIDHDPALRGRLYLNELRHNIGIDGGLPWDKTASVWGNRDDANLRGWLENRYGITGKDKIRDALDIVITQHRRHPIREYLTALHWDGVPRLERLIIDYVGAEDNALNRAITRIHFTAAVARVMTPGCKYDYCLILAGPQGVGKSTLIAIMGGEYYKDGLTSMEGKEGAEQVRGSHLIEIGELDGMKRSELSAVKQFITARVDEYRPAYAVHKEAFPRQCVFFGTTNEQYFLKDETGNRRFPIIPINPELRTRGALWFDALRAERDQLWAEAVAYWRRGDRLSLPDELEAESRQRQTEYLDSDADELRGLLSQFLDTRLPADWPTWDLQRRRAWLRNPDPLDAEGVVLRDRVCAAEFICERLGREMTDKDYRYLSRKVGRLLKEMGWNKSVASRHAVYLYGVQKAYFRPKDATENCKQKL